MFRRFLSDRRGNFMLLTAAAIVPIMGGLAVAVDYAEMSRQRQLTLNALDAAGVATARQLIGGNSTDAQLVAYAQQFFEANLGSVDPRNATLHVTLPTATGGGGKIKLSADLTYKPYFLPTLAALMGKDASSSTQVDFTASTEVQMKNTLEIALVLDNSGSMDYTGSGSGKKRITLLKDAAKQLVDSLSTQATQMKQVDKPVQFAVVPFAASVNVGSTYSTASWMDLEGRSPIHHENFDWATMDQSKASANGNRYVQLSSGVYYKKGAGWGDQENKKVTRFTLFEDLKRQTGTQSVKTGTTYGCTQTNWRGNCTAWGYIDVYEDRPVYGAYASWQGCVEARPYPYNTTDAIPATGTPATLFVPMFAPDETDNRDSNWRSASGNYWADKTTSSNNATRQKYMPKYFEPAGTSMSAAGWGEGPNASCTTTAITPLTDVTVTAGKTKIKDAIDAMSPNGATNVPEGIAWGWRAVSGGAPFTEGRGDSENGNDKVVIVLTDGENTYYTPNSLGYNDLADNKSVYSAYGYTGLTQAGGTSTRLFMGTGSDVSKSDYSNDNYSAALNGQMAATCDNAKTAGMIVMTVALDLSTSDTQQKKQIAGLKSCASDSRFRKDASDPTKPAKLFWNTTGGNLSQTFKEIADELSNLRITS
jgi:Flp pilus assembly protein TadG